MQHGYKRIFLQTSRKFTSGHEFYLRKGFRVVRRNETVWEVDLMELVL